MVRHYGYSISKTASVSDKLVWKYSADGEYKVRTAYSLVLPVLEPGVQCEN